MIARHEAHMDKTDIWAKLAARLPAGAFEWRQDGKPLLRDGKHFARFVGYISAGTVRERLDSIVPGEWDLTLELLPARPDAEDDADKASFKARLQILGVIREDVGAGRDYKAAATDAFKRAAVRFGIGHELYELEPNWVQVDGDGKFAKPVEDPTQAYIRRHGALPGGVAPAAAAAPAPTAEQRGAKEPYEQPTPVGLPAQAPAPKPAPAAAPANDDADPACPKCGGRMWDNRVGKRNPKAPDFKCRDRSCDGVVWPPKPGKGGKARETLTLETDDDFHAFAAQLDAETDLPF